MWKLVNGALVNTTDESRINNHEFRISKIKLDEIGAIAEKHNSYKNYVIENGLTNLLKLGEIDYNKKQRPKDRIRYGSSYDKELIESVKLFAKEHGLYTGDVVEYSIDFVNEIQLPNKSYRNRVERE